MTLEEYRTGHKPYTSYISWGNIPWWKIVRYHCFGLSNEAAKELAAELPEYDFAALHRRKDWPRGASNSVSVGEVCPNCGKDCRFYLKNKKYDPEKSCAWYAEFLRAPLS